MLVAWPDHVGFFLAPLALLLAVSHPRTARERIWLALLVVWAAVWLLQPAALAQTSVRAAAVIGAGAFVVGMLWRPTAPFRTMAIAAALGIVAVAAWSAGLGLAWPEFQTAVAEYGMQAYRQFATAAGTPPGLDPAAVRRTFRAVARFYPGITFAAALAGMGLAWGLYHRVAVGAVGTSPSPFRAFRFADHLVWVVIAGLALALSPLPAPFHTVAGNALLVMAGLYLVRGAAVVAAVMPAPGWLLTLVIAIVAVLLAPLAGTSLVVIGIADTWIDFRRRLPPAAQGAHS